MINHKNDNFTAFSSFFIEYEINFNLYINIFKKTID